MPDGHDHRHPSGRCPPALPAGPCGSASTVGARGIIVALWLLLFAAAGARDARRRPADDAAHTWLNSVSDAVDDRAATPTRSSSTSSTRSARPQHASSRTCSRWTSTVDRLDRPDHRWLGVIALVLRAAGGSALLRAGRVLRHGPAGAVAAEHGHPGADADARSSSRWRRHPAGGRGPGPTTGSTRSSHRSSTSCRPCRRFAYLPLVTLLFAIGPASAIDRDVDLRGAAGHPDHGRRHPGGPRDTVEAAESLGTTRSQMLRKVTLPMAKSTIVIGINQTIDGGPVDGHPRRADRRPRPRPGRAAGAERPRHRHRPSTVVSRSSSWRSSSTG